MDLILERSNHAPWAFRLSLAQIFRRQCSEFRNRMATAVVVVTSPHDAHTTPHGACTDARPGQAERWFAGPLRHYSCNRLNDPNLRSAGPNNLTAHDSLHSSSPVATSTPSHAAPRAQTIPIRRITSTNPSHRTPPT